jgi:hypothetical protein
VEKGKMVVDQDACFPKKSTVEYGKQKVRQKWSSLQVHVKLNVDGGVLKYNGEAFAKKKKYNGEAGIGMVLGDHRGDVIMAAYRELQTTKIP